MKQKEDVLYAIKKVIAQVMPIDSKVMFFGSPDRGDARTDSDWSILILMDEDKLEVTEHNNYSYPLCKLCWKVDVQIYPIMYTLKD